jgi:AcrR family transcriptional regulator
VETASVSPQRSNRAHLIEGTLRCLERLPPERITARVIAEESGANLASITYHFGSKDSLVTEAAIEGLDRWLADIAVGLGDLESQEPATRFRRVGEVIEASRRRHTGLARNFVGALAKAQHDTRIRELLAAGFLRTRPNVASLLGLGGDQAGQDAAGLALSLFHGLLIQVLLDPVLAIDGDRMERAQARLLRVLPDRRD